MNGTIVLEAPLPIAIVLAWLGLVVSCFVQEARIIRRLRLVHHAKWEELGRPSALVRARNRALSRYLKSRTFRELGDPRLDRMLAVMSILSGAGIAAFFCVVMLFFVVPAVLGW